MVNATQEIPRIGNQELLQDYQSRKKTLISLGVTPLNMLVEKIVKHQIRTGTQNKTQELLIKQAFEYDFKRETPYENIFERLIIKDRFSEGTLGSIIQLLESGYSPYVRTWIRLVSKPFIDTDDKSYILSLAIGGNKKETEINAIRVGKEGEVIHPKQHLLIGA